jgi:hypothetical protein
LNIAEKNKSIVSRVIADAVEDKLVKPEDEGQGKRYARYRPWWA